MAQVERRPPVQVGDLAELMGVHRHTVLRHIAAGDVAATKVGGRYFVPADEVDRICGVGASLGVNGLAEHIARVVASAPPLTPAQIDRLTGLLRPAEGAAA